MICDRHPGLRWSAALLAAIVAMTLPAVSLAQDERPEQPSSFGQAGLYHLTFAADIDFETFLPVSNTDVFVEGSPVLLTLAAGSSHPSTPSCACGSTSTPDSSSKTPARSSHPLTRGSSSRTSQKVAPESARTRRNSTTTACPRRWRRSGSSPKATRCSPAANRERLSAPRPPRRRAHLPTYRPADPRLRSRVARRLDLLATRPIPARAPMLLGRRPGARAEAPLARAAAHPSMGRRRWDPERIPRE